MLISYDIIDIFTRRQCLISAWRTQLYLVWPVLRKHECGSTRARTKNCDFACHSLFFLHFLPFSTITYYLLHNGYIRLRVKYVETASPIMRIQFLTVNSTRIYSSLGRCNNHRLNRVSGALWLIFTRVKTVCFASFTRFTETNN